MNGNSNSNYAQNNSDSRYYNDSYSGWGVSFPATHTSCKDLPNVNEMTWYAANGDPRWDADELWTTMGHLYKGGMWFKKKAYISGFNANTAVDGTDWQIHMNVYSKALISHILPNAADASKYFYLPALGWYVSGQQDYVGMFGYYWSSSAQPGGSNGAYHLEIGSGNVGVSHTSSSTGFRVGAFE